MKFKYLVALALMVLVLVMLPVAAECLYTDQRGDPTANGIYGVYTSGNEPYPPNGTCGNTWFKIDPVEDLVTNEWTWVYDGDYANPYSLTLVTVDDILVDWYVDGGSFTGYIVVKGGPGYLTYHYTDSYGDEGLHSPVNFKPNGECEYSGISHVSVCGEVTPNEEECWCNETAWAAGSRYITKGNWATFTPYVAGNTVTLFAGKTKDAGDVYFSEADGGYVDIIITLNEGWRFADVLENVKIQNYATAPSGNPSPGLFACKYTADASPFSTGYTMPISNFYGVHADVQWLCPCTSTPAS